MDTVDARLARLYDNCSGTVDELPYTAEFDELFSRTVEEGLPIEDRHQLWRRLSNLRKRGLLSRKRR